MFRINEEHWISSLTLGEIIGVTDERVRQLEDKGILECKMQGRKKLFDLVPSVNAYINFIKEPSTPVNTDISLATAKADLKYKESRAGKMELELKELQGTMHRAEDVEVIVTDMIAKLRAAILALPGRLAVDTAAATTAKETSAVIKKAVDELLNEMAEYKYNENDYKKRVMEREKWVSVQEAEQALKEATKSTKRSTISKTSAKALKPRKT